jgi:hypothetical protein
LYATAPIHRAASAVVNLATKRRIVDSLEQLCSVALPVMLVAALVGALVVVARLSLIRPPPAVVVLPTHHRSASKVVVPPSEDRTPSPFLLRPHAAGDLLLYGQWS